MNYQLLDMDDSHQQFVLETRNSPEVRKNMYTTHEISLSEHQSWWERTQGDASKKYFVCKADELLIGVVGFYDMDSVRGTGEWAFYASSNAPRGSGTQMEFLALEKAFGTLGLRKLNCEVLSYNMPVVRLHQKFGFRIEGVKKQEHRYEDKYYDIYQLSIFAKDWGKYLKNQAETALVTFDKSQTWVGRSFEAPFCIQADDVKAFAELSGDHNPIHFDDQAAKDAGFPCKIAHGGISVAKVSQILGMEFPGQGTIIVQQKYDYLAPIFCGQDLMVKFKVLSQLGKKLIVNVTVTSEDKDLIVGEAEVFCRSL